MKTVTKIIFASAIILSAAAPAAFAQSFAPGNTSVPGIGVLKDDTTLQKPHVSNTTREHASRSSSQTFGWGNASTPGAGVIKDDTIPYGK